MNNFGVPRQVLVGGHQLILKQTTRAFNPNPWSAQASKPINQNARLLTNNNKTDTSYSNVDLPKAKTFDNSYHAKPTFRNKRQKTSPAQFHKSVSVLRSRSSSGKDNSGTEAEQYSFIRLKPKTVTSSTDKTGNSVFQPPHHSTPHQPTDWDDVDDIGSDVGSDSCKLDSTPVWRLPESESDSGLSSDNDTDDDNHVDFPFKITKGKELYPKSRVPFIDTHCHLDYMYVKEAHFKSFRAYVHKKDFPVNFSGCITCFCDPPAIEDSEYYGTVLSEVGVWGTFGLHPHNASRCTDDILDLLVKANSHEKSLAWGEIGLDYNSQITDEVKHVQQRAFIMQLQAAVNMQKAIVIHGRDAHEDTFNLLKQYVPTNFRIHYHCFNGSLEFANRLRDFFPNLFIGITGIVTYKNTQLETVVQEFPFDRLLIETDAPYLRPYYRTYVDRDTPRTATPGMGIIVAQKIAEVKGLELDDVLIQVRENVNLMYNI